MKQILQSVRGFVSIFPKHALEVVVKNWRIRTWSWVLCQEHRRARCAAVFRNWQFSWEEHVHLAEVDCDWEVMLGFKSHPAGFVSQFATSYSKTTVRLITRICSNLPCPSCKSAYPNSWRLQNKDTYIIPIISGHSGMRLSPPIRTTKPEFIPWSMQGPYLPMAANLWQDQFGPLLHCLQTSP